MMDFQKEDVQVVLKFQYGKRGSPNPIISRTLGRVAVISHGYQGPMPQVGCFWLCRIEKQMNFNEVNGCFVVVPIHKIEIENIVKLVPGAYDTEVMGSSVVCRPRVSGLNWILPFSLKKFFIKKDKASVLYQSVIVPVQIDGAQKKKVSET